MPKPTDNDTTGAETTVATDLGQETTGAPAADALSPGAGGETSTSPADAASSPAASAAGVTFTAEEVATLAGATDLYLGTVGALSPSTGVGHGVMFYSTNLDLTGLSSADEGVPALVTRAPGSGLVDLTVFRANGAPPIGLAGIAHESTGASTHWK